MIIIEARNINNELPKKKGEIIVNEFKDLK